MPRHRNKKRRRSQPNPANTKMIGIEEQLRLQRLAANEPKAANKDDPPPAKLGSYVYDPARNAYFPEGTVVVEKEEDFPKIVEKRYVPISRRYPSLLHATECCNRSSERRRLWNQWRGEKALQRLSIIPIMEGDVETQPNELYGVPLWYRNFTKAHSTRSYFFHFRSGGTFQKRFAGILPSTATGLTGTSYSAIFGSEEEKYGTMKTRRIGKVSTRTMNGLTCHGFGDFGSCIRLCLSDGEDFGSSYTHLFQNHRVEDFTVLDDFHTFVAAAQTLNKSVIISGDLATGSLNGIMEHGRDISSAVLTLESAPWAGTDVAVAGHRDGHVSSFDLRSGSQAATIFCPPDSEFGNIVGLHTASTTILAQGSGGSCRLFDIRKTGVLQEICPPAKPQWMGATDTLCKGMAVDPTNSIVLLPEATQDSSISSPAMCLGVWSLLTGDYLGTKGSFPTKYLELCSFVAESTQVPHRPAVWADLGRIGLAEIQMDGRI